jgi:hypothetical protein
VAHIEQVAFEDANGEAVRPLALFYSGRSFSTVRPLVHATLTKHCLPDELPRHSQLPLDADHKSFSAELIEWCCARPRSGPILIIGDDVDERTKALAELADTIASDLEEHGAKSRVGLLIASTAPLLFPKSQRASIFLVPCVSIHASWNTLANLVITFCLAEPSRLATTYESALSSIRATPGASYVVSWLDLVSLPDLETCAGNVFATELLESTFTNQPFDCFRDALNQVEGEMRKGGAFDSDPEVGTFRFALKREQCKLAIADLANLVVQGTSSIAVFCDRLSELTQGLNSRIFEELCQDLIQESRGFEQDTIQLAGRLLHSSKIDLTAVHSAARGQVKQILAKQRFPLMSYFTTFSTIGVNAVILDQLKRSVDLVRKALIAEVAWLKDTHYQNVKRQADAWTVNAEALDVLSFLPRQFSTDARDELWNLNKLATMKIYRKVG